MIDFMSLESSIKNAWKSTVDVVKSKRVIQNYPNDLIAGNLSRTPVYAVFDNAILGIPDENVLDAGLNAAIYSACGYGLVYVLGNSLVAKGFEKIYSKHAKLIDALYSSAITFGFGMAVTLTAGYSVKQSLAASSVRAAIAFPLGPLTRYFTDAFRDVRGEPVMSRKTNFKDKSLLYQIPRVAAMIATPIALFFGTLALTLDKEEAPQQDIDKKEINYVRKDSDYISNSKNSYYADFC